MFTKYNEQCKKVMLTSREEMKNLKQLYIGTEHFLLAILKNNKLSITKKLNKYNIYYENFKSKLISTLGIGDGETNYYVYTPLLKHILEEAEQLAKNLNEEYVSIEHILCIMFDENEGVAIRVIIEMGVNIEMLSKEFSIKRTKKNNKKKYLIEEYGYNMNQKAKDDCIDPVIGREKERDRIIEILCRRRKNNPLLIGDAGVGKTAIVEELSKRIVDEKVPNSIKKKKVISISMSGLISGTKYRGEFEERINKMLNEVESSDDLILFIDEIHTLVGAGGAEGAIDAANILKPFLARGKIKLIGATTIQEYKRYLECEKALDRRFQTVLIDEPKSDSVLEILKMLRPLYEKYHNVTVEDDVLKSIVQLSNKYIYDRKQPDKAIDILDEACSKTSLKKDKTNIEIEKLNEELNNVIKSKNEAVINHNFIKACELKKKEMDLNTRINIHIYNKRPKSVLKKVSLRTVALVVKSKTGIPIYELLNDDLKQLNNLEKMLKSKIVGQEYVIEEVSKDIKKIKLGYKFENKPRSYLFVGPTGVGKTMLAKEISKLISDKENLIRLDMSEYREEHSVSKIIGSPPGYVGFSEKNSILEEIKIKPNAVILLDEIEKASKSVLNLFLQILDEGFIKSSYNEIVRFDNNIIIMTSNLGYYNESLGFGDGNEKHVLSKINEFLGIELVNRIDSVYIFNKLNENDVINIIKTLEKKIIKKLNIKSQNRYLNKNDIANIISKSDYYIFGARKLEKLVSDIIINKIIKEKSKKNVKLTIEA